MVLFHLRTTELRTERSLVVIYSIKAHQKSIHGKLSEVMKMLALRHFGVA